MEPAPVKASTLDKLEFEVELLTRQFGGGIKAREVEIDRWLRPTAIKGALRFWWRALFGASLPDREVMRKREGEIFGSLERPELSTEGTTVREALGGASSFRLTVETMKEPQTAPFTGKATDILTTAYFPALEQTTGAVPAASLGEPGAVARIQLSRWRTDSEAWQQLRHVLTAFVVFGGAGARTRRAAGGLGFRTLENASKVNAPKSLEELRTWLSQHLKGTALQTDFFVVDQQARIFSSRAAEQPETAQKWLLTALKEARRAKTSRVDVKALRGSSRGTAEDALFEPRAHMGLPIQYKDLLGTNRDASLLPDSGDRYASPVLLSVYKIFQPSVCYVGVALLTPSRLDVDPRLMDGQTPLRRLSAGASNMVYEELVNSLTKQKFEEIKRPQA